MKTATKKVTEQATENFNKVVDLTQQTAEATLKTSVEATKVAEDSIQGLYKVGYDLNAAGLNVAKGYWDALSAIRNEWINLASQTGEKAVESISVLKNLEIPFQKEINDFSANLYAQGEKVVNMATEQVKNVASTVTEQVGKTTETVAKQAKKATETATTQAQKATKTVAEQAKKTAATVTKQAEKAAETVEATAKKATSTK